MSTVRGSRAGVALLALILVLTGAVGLTSLASAQEVSVTDLRVEHRDRPLGIDVAQPRFSWVNHAEERGAAQTHYRVVVGESEAAVAEGTGDVWDSGEVASDLPYGISYNGPELAPATRYYWRVEVRTNVEPDAVASEVSWFETGLPEAQWAGADWISAPAEDDEPDVELAGANWIWYPDGIAPLAPEGERFFRRTFEVEDAAAVASAELVVAADDLYTAYQGGAELGSSSDSSEAWREATVYPLNVSTGENVVAVHAENRLLASGQQSPAGLLAKIYLRYTDGTVTELVTDEQWLSTQSVEDGWTEVGYDDTSWEASVVHAPYGEGDWGSNVVIMAEPEPAPLLRTDFAIDGEVASARLYIAAGGFVDARLNGQPVADEVLSVGTTDFANRVQYATHDVTDLVAAGENALGVELGRGFYGLTTTNSWNWDNAPWHAAPTVRAVLRVTTTDGTVQDVVTDDAWTTVDGPTRFDSLYEGDVYDARLERPGFDTAGYDDSAWAPADVVTGPAGELVARVQQPVRVVETLSPTRIENPAPGVYVAHLPRQVSGWARITVDGPAGTQVGLRYSERLLPDGNIDLSTGFTGGSFQTDRYTLAGGGAETWEPKFSYKGFAYVEITGWPGEAPTVEDIEGRLLHNDVAVTGSFDSSTELFDTIYDATVLTVLNNFHHLPTDTPKYEKNGWTGDAQLGAEMFLRNLDVQPFLRKWLDDVSDSRNAEGRPALIAPDPDWIWAGADESPTWHSAYVLIPWWMYEYTGDTDVLASHYEGMLRYVELEHATAVDNISSTGLGDYLPPDAVGNPPEDMRVSATAYVYLMTQTMADIADVLGEESADLRVKAEEIREAFNAVFYDEESQTYRDDVAGYRQTHNVLALAFGLVPDDEAQAVADNLARDIVEERDSHLWTGVLGTKYLLPVLTEHGHGELAYTVATQTDFPSWGRWFEEGSTSLWEHWGDYRSRNHYFLGGTIDDWFYEDIAGITILEPAYRRFAVAPTVLEDMTRAHAATDTPFGRIDTSWERTEESFELTVDVPVGTTAEVTLPVGQDDAVVESGVLASEATGVELLATGEATVTFAVSSGSYDFTVGPVATEEPTTPGPEPTTPGEEPTTPGEEPTTPGEEPTTPGPVPTTPGVEPTMPGEEPTTPGVAPTAGDPSGDLPATGSEPRAALLAVLLLLTAGGALLSRRYVAAARGR